MVYKCNSIGHKVQKAKAANPLPRRGYGYESGTGWSAERAIDNLEILRSFGHSSSRNPFSAKDASQGE
jgi:hypothetical protein